MAEKNKLLAWRKIIIGPFCKKAEKSTLKICDSTIAEEQRALKET